jgi:FixJ family two-component response regulator
MLIALVDDDDSMRSAMGSLLRAAGHDVRLFASAEEFVAARLEPACLILDNRLPAMSGLDLQRHLEQSGVLVPVVFVTSADDSAAELAALVARGAVVAQFTKPFEVDDFLAAVEKACRR